MQIKTLTAFFLVALFLSSCVPVTMPPLPTETAAPTATLIPAPTFTATVTPTSTPEALAVAKDLSFWVEEFVNAYGGKITVNNTEMDANQLTDEIRKNYGNFAQKRRVDDIEFSFLVVNDVPLAVLKNGVWNKTTIQFLGNIVHIRFGSTAHEGNLFVNHTVPYGQILNDQFEIISPIDPTILDVSDVLKDPYYGKFIKDFAPAHTIRFYNLFWSADHRANGQPNLKDPLWEGAPKAGKQSSPEYQEKIKAAMAQKALDILTNNPYVTEIGFANEAFAATDDGYFAWEDSPYYRAFGDRWLIEAYLATYRAIIQLGKTPGKDIQIFYGDYNYEWPGNKSNILHRELSRLKMEVAKALGVKPQDVPLVVDMQCHVIFKNNNPENPFYWGQFYAGNISYEKLKSNFESFSDIGKVWLGEVTFLEGTREQYTDTLSTLVKASIDSGNVESILFWDLLETDSDHWGNGNLLLEFNGTDKFVPTITYFELLKTLFAAK